MSLDIERVWFIECWRCANNEAADMATDVGAQDYFRKQGWGKTRDGLQMCPQCNGKP